MVVFDNAVVGIGWGLLAMVDRFLHQGAGWWLCLPVQTSRRLVLCCYNATNIGANAEQCLACMPLLCSVHAGLRPGFGSEFALLVLCFELFAGSPSVGGCGCIALLLLGPLAFKRAPAWCLNPGCVALSQRVGAGRSPGGCGRCIPLARPYARECCVAGLRSGTECVCGLWLEELNEGVQRAVTVLQVQTQST